MNTLEHISIYETVYVRYVGFARINILPTYMYKGRAALKR